MTKIIKFSKPGCQPCELASNLMQDLGLSYEEINPFDQPDLAVKYQIRSVPTVLILDGEKELERIIGFDAGRLRSLARFA